MPAIRYNQSIGDRSSAVRCQEKTVLLCGSTFNGKCIYVPYVFVYI